MFQFWRRSNRAVLIVSESPTASLFDSEFLRRPEIRLMTAYPDDQAMEIARYSWRFGQFGLNASLVCTIVETEPGRKRNRR